MLMPLKKHNLKHGDIPLVEEIFEPMIRYKNEYREKFEQLVADEFEKLLKKSGVKPSENIALVKQIEQQEKHKKKERLKRNIWLIGLITTVVLAIIGIIMLIDNLNSEDELTETGIVGIVIAAVSIALLFGIVPMFRKYFLKVKNLESDISDLTQKAWDQMRPLNELFGWDVTEKLISKTCPHFKFDPYFSSQRLHDMKKSFGWEDDFNADRSVIYAHSGEFNGNPFVFAETKKICWETKVYTGKTTINWTEKTVGEDGQVNATPKSQTLVATVEKPVPVFVKDKFMLYGHEAAQNLSFGREHPDHTGSGNDFIASTGTKIGIQKLEDLTPSLDNSPYGNSVTYEEFELLFHAINRDHEVEYHLLFSQLAQQQMVRLLKDRGVGFGDDFSFYKVEKMNMIRANNLKDLEFQADPERFSDYSLDKVKEKFISCNRNFFKSFYFTFAPLLTIPLYQKKRSYPAVPYGLDKKVSFWEHEAIANFYGDSVLANPECNTETIMKTRVLEELPDGSTKFSVLSRGFKKEPRIDSISVYGEDGKYHPVSVKWEEFLPSDKETVLLVMEKGNPEIPGDVDRVRSNLNIWQCLYRDSRPYRKLFTCITD